MDNLRCAEYLSESPSTSSTLNAALIVSQNRRRSGKITEQNCNRTCDVTRLVLGQLPTNRKRPAPAEKLNNSQFPSVPPLKDRAIHQDNRCLDSLFKSQDFSAVRGNYFLNLESKITPKHRQQAMEWLYDVCKEEHCEPDVFPLAVSYIDRFLNMQSICREDLQVLASVCLFIASKVKAPQPLYAKKIAYYTDGGVHHQEILNWELVVLTKLNWDVSTATALDFLDQVSARYTTLQYLSEACRNAVHRIQLEEKFAFLVPSVQAAVCLLFAAVKSKIETLILTAEHAVFNILRCDPKIVYHYMEAVNRAVDGSYHQDTENDTSPGTLIAPPSSSTYMSPASTPLAIFPPLTAVTSSYVTPDHCSRASDDSGFNSGFSSPAANGELKNRSSSREEPPRRSRRCASRVGNKTMENRDNGLITSFYLSEQDFLQNF